MREHTLQNRGFTIIEIIAVLIVMGILSAVAISRFSSLSAFEVKSEADVVKTRLRLAQSRAMGTNSVWGIKFDTPGTYFLFRNGTTADQIAFVGEDSVTAALPSGVSVTTGVVSFDQWGVPHTDAAAAVPQSGTRTISLSGGGESASFTIIEDTGFIP